MMNASGRKWPSVLQQRVARWRYAVREWLVGEVCVVDGADTYKFRCHSPLEELRARSLFIKEEGTIRWIKESVKPGDVFYDVGANVGLYSLVAGRKVGRNGRVVAFEAHPANLCSLLGNINANKMAGRISVQSCAVHASEGIFDFNFRSLQPGCAMNQLGGNIDGDGHEFRPQAVTGQYASSLDNLVECEVTPPPDHIKIDVDGNELKILDGMQQILNGPNRPRTIQVEVNHGFADEIDRRLSDCGFARSERHFTYHGKLQIKNGKDPLLIPHNAVYSRNAA